MNQTSSHINNTLTDQAVDWCMRLHEEDLSPEENQEFESWIDTDQQHAQAYEKALKIWNLSAQLMPSYTAVPQAEDSPAKALPVQDNITVLPVIKKQHSSNWPVFARAACLVLFVLPLISYIGWQLNLVPNSYQYYSAQENRQHFTLPDGSHIELNLNTELTYANYRHHRQVSLNHGEAYFNVAHDEKHPFVVAAASGEITVTGTRFNVWKYHDNVTVTVTEGSVIVKNHHVERNLSPGLQAKFNAQQPKLIVNAIDTNQALAWRYGQLILDDIALSEAIPLINIYLKDSQLILASQSVAKLRIGGIYHTKDIDNLVTILAEILPINIDKQPDGSILLSRKNSPNS